MHKRTPDSTRGAGPTSGQCWPIVCDAGPNTNLAQGHIDIACPLGGSRQQCRRHVVHKRQAKTDSNTKPTLLLTPIQHWFQHQAKTDSNTKPTLIPAPSQDWLQHQSNTDSNTKPTLIPTPSQHWAQHQANTDFIPKPTLISTPS